MKKKVNKNGFAMAETVICIVIVVGIITMLYNLIYPIIGKSDASINYEGLDTKYLAYYIKEMIETDSNTPNPITTASYSYYCGSNCNYYVTETYKCRTNNCGADPTPNGALDSVNYEKITDGVYFDSETSDTDVANTDGSHYTVNHYTNQNQLCNKLDNGSFKTKDATGSENKYLKNNKYFCNQFINAAHITNIYVTKYNTTSFKEYVKSKANRDKFPRRSFREYVAYMPTHQFASNALNRKLLIIEQEHDATTQSGDKYYTYASIEVK